MGELGGTQDRRKEKRTVIQDGICKKCGDEISPARLAARPFTRLCTGCKAEQDELPHTAGSKLVRGALVESSLSDLDEMAHRTREVRGEE